jgi:SHS2 domain-containing protein
VTERSVPENVTTSTEGYREIEHTADWALEVWGPDLEALFVQAALGMCSLLGVRLVNGPRERLSLDLKAADSETLLVDFLNELLFLVDRENFGPDRIDLEIRDQRLAMVIDGAQIAERGKEIKAATFAGLVIRRGEHGLETRVVFDV